LGEHRNEHQLATARKMDELKFVNVAYDEHQLQKQILNSEVQCLQGLGDKASDSLILSLKHFILDE